MGPGRISPHSAIRGQEGHTAISEGKQKTFGEILHYARKSRNLTIKQLEDRSGVSASFISRIENEQGNPSVEIVRKLAEALEIPLSDFFHDQKGGKILYPLRLSQARLLQEAAMVDLLDQLIPLSPDQRLAVLDVATGAIRLCRALQANPGKPVIPPKPPDFLEGATE